MNYRVVLLLMLVLNIYVFSAERRVDVKNLSIIPAPNKIEAGHGVFVCDKNTSVVCGKDSRDVADYFVSEVSPAIGFRPAVADPVKGKSIVLAVDKALEGQLGAEGYQLRVESDKIEAKAAANAGLFYAVQTLRQLMGADVFSDKPLGGKSIEIPCVAITDVPRFKWRGLHLDAGRCYMPVEFVKKFIDLLAVHKMNVFHFHLTEDQGWRIEIKKYPRLTEVGSWRDGTLIGHKKDLPNKYDGVRYGGFYTQQQLRDIVDYAAQRYITVVPEIEMPGHALAALAAYPQYSCTGGPHSVQMGWGIFDDIYCAGNDETFTFLQDILDEVMEIFPSPYIHIGGDEAPKKRWQQCPKCQARIKAQGLKDEFELQSYFITRMEKYVNSKGRNIIGWDEILEGGLAPNAAVMSWRGEKGGIEAANSGHNVVMTPTDYCYLDYYQSDDKEKEPLAIGGLLTLEKTYSYDPVSPELAPDKRRFVMGVQGNVWTEYMKTPADVEYMTYPRACAIAEIGWTQPENKEPENFKTRLAEHLRRLDYMNVNYRK